MAEDFSFCQLRVRNNEIKLETLSFRFPASCFPVICFSCALLMPVPLALSSHSWVLLVLRWWWWTASLSILLLVMLHQCHSPPGCRSLLFHRCSCAAAGFKCTHTHRFDHGDAGQMLPGWFLWPGMMSSACWVLAGKMLTAFCSRWKDCLEFEEKCSKTWGFFSTFVDPHE